MTLRQLSAASGATASNLSRYEQGHTMPRLDTLHRVVAGLGLTIADLHRAQQTVAHLPEKAENGTLPPDTGTPQARTGRQAALRLAQEAGKAVAHCCLAFMEIQAGGWPGRLPGGRPAPPSGVSGLSAACSQSRLPRGPASAGRCSAATSTAASTPTLPNLVKVLRAMDCTAEDFGQAPWTLGMPRLKVTTLTVRASQEQARRWARVARYLGCRSVSAWLEELADEQSLRVEDRRNSP
jgi:transcriptional regulator with XRE-family HTH domain